MSGRRPGLGSLLQAALLLAYPALVYVTLVYFEPRVLALLLLLMAVLRLRSGQPLPGLHAAVGVALLLAVLALAWNHSLPAKLYPVAMNLLLLLLFATSLRHPPSIIERLARLREPELPAAAVAYTRRVTQVWCGFFVLNGSIALWTALAASDRVWALYNGLLAYLMMGLLFAGEWLLRQRLRSRHA